MGGIDIVVNSAGIGAQGTVEANPIEEWRRVFDVNVFGMVRVVRAALPHLRLSSHAAVVNTCSVAATAGLPERALYSATKGAVLSLTLAMAADHLHEGIRVNCVNPGTTDTPWIGWLLVRASDPAAERAALEARQHSGRLVTAEEVAAAILYLAGLSAGAMTARHWPSTAAWQVSDCGLADHASSAVCVTDAGQGQTRPRSPIAVTQTGGGGGLRVRRASGRCDGGRV